MTTDLTVIPRTPSDVIAEHLKKSAELHTSGNIHLAIDEISKVLNINPNNLEALTERGNFYREVSDYQRSIVDLQRAVDIEPSALHYFYLGNTLGLTDQRELALTCYGEALSLFPMFPEALNNRGLLLTKLDRYVEANSDFETALRIKPITPSIYTNYGRLLWYVKNPVEALAYLDKGIVEGCVDPAGLLARSVIQIGTGNFEEGWKNYEARFTAPDWVANIRSWATYTYKDGDSLEGKNVVIHTEQGAGDFIHFLRYVKLIKDKGANVSLIPHRLMHDIARSYDPDIKLLSDISPEVPEYDYCFALMSLPYICKTTVDTIPDPTPYIFSDPKKSKWWKRQIGDAPINVGIVWAGGKEHTFDRLRSMSLSRFKPLFELPIEYHSLHITMSDDDRAVLESTPNLHNYSSHLFDFSQTAALINELDLVITIDTSVAHLSAAMGKPTWILLNYVPDYRWFLDGETSPWYSSATLIRQPVMHDWDGVFEEVVDKLKSHFNIDNTI